MRHMDSRARGHLGMALVSALGFALLIALGACGGSSGAKNVDEPAVSGSDEDAPVDREGDQNMVPAEKVDEIRSFFDRKRSTMSRCFLQSIEAGEMPRNASGRVTITLTITAQGKLTRAKVTEMKPESQVLERCILDNIARWTVTTLPRSFDYSHTYGFESL